MMFGVFAQSSVAIVPDSLFVLPLEELDRDIYPSFTTGVLILRIGKPSPCFDHILRITIVERGHGARQGTGSSALIRHRGWARTLLASAAIACALALAGCETDGLSPTVSAKAMAPLSSEIMALLEQKNMPKDSPILVRLFKEEAELEVWKQDTSGQYALLKTYPICRWSGELGPKIKQGDRQAPEGFYSIAPGQMNPNSAWYLSFNIGFPNAYDRANDRTGQFLMVHGDCSSAGCYAMTDEQMGEIYALGREAFLGGQKEFQIQAYPFHMTALNMARHRNNPAMPFWRMIKQGNDVFETTRQEPKVDVCGKHYVFNADERVGQYLQVYESFR